MRNFNKVYYVLPQRTSYFSLPRQGSVIPYFSVLFLYPPGSITGPGIYGPIEAQVIMLIQQALASLIQSGTLGPYIVLPGLVPNVTAQGEFDVISNSLAHIPCYQAFYLL